jgi:trans-2,3-dihydro-3-hydroxyanthranilate isomerase
MANGLHLVDVFAERRHAGNQLAVVVDSGDLASETMLDIAAEMNFSETTFVRPEPEHDGGYRVRIFTPAAELPFAGHPTLGTAWVVRHHLAPALPGTVRLNLGIGAVPVAFEPADEGPEIAWLTAPPVVLGRRCEREQAAAALGLEPEDLDERAPVQELSAGISAVIVPVRNADALHRSRLDLERFAPLARAGCRPFVYVFCGEPRDSANQLAARFFFDANGVREDPATGSATALLGAYLLEHRTHVGSGDGMSPLSLRIEQGIEIRRPSLLRLRARRQHGERVIEVGGGVIPVASGHLR